MRKFSHLYVIMFLIISISSSLYSYGIKEELEDLIDGSELIITGKVSQIVSKFEKYQEHTLVYTYVTVDCTSIINGNLETISVAIKMLGGTINGIGNWSDSYIPFTKDEEVLLFLNYIDRSQNLFKINSISGKIPINYENDKKVVDCSMLRKNPNKEIESYMKLEKLLKIINKYLNNKEM